VPHINYDLTKLSTLATGVIFASYDDYTPELTLLSSFSADQLLCYRPHSSSIIHLRTHWPNKTRLSVCPPVPAVLIVDSSATLLPALTPREAVTSSLSITDITAHPSDIAHSALPASSSMQSLWLLSSTQAMHQTYETSVCSNCKSFGLLVDVYQICFKLHLLSLLALFCSPGTVRSSPQPLSTTASGDAPVEDVHNQYLCKPAASFTLIL
jgi:hypothetical protein